MEGPNMTQNLQANEHVLTEVRGGIGCITLNRPQAMNALSLPMIRALTAQLLAWRDDPQVLAVALRGNSKTGPFGAFCAGGDIRFFYQAALHGDPALEDFFTEEYSLNHLIHRYPKPTLAFMDGTVMGGGMGLAQGARWRIVTERTKMAMPETGIGLFPDVGGGYFLSRCPGRVGEYLALTGEVIGAEAALRYGLADMQLSSGESAQLWDDLGTQAFADIEAVTGWMANRFRDCPTPERASSADIDAFFGLADVLSMARALQAASDNPWAEKTLTLLRRRSPLMLHVVLEQIRRARRMTLDEDLRMERDMVRHCFRLRPGAASETVEGIRALAVDKDNAPRWNPAGIEEVLPEQVQAFFVSPWPAHAHPLRGLA
jgi:enoyl-CoA hydratase/carnithine racemase